MIIRKMQSKEVRMEKNRRLEWLLECLIHVIGRAAIKVEEVHRLAAIRGKYTQEYINAFNLCDGTLTLGDIVERTGLDQGNLSRVVDRWVKQGIVFRYEEGSEVRLLHVFPISDNSEEKPNARGKKR
jgi:DNA-binding MarR family transcriptional regulator